LQGFLSTKGATVTRSTFDSTQPDPAGGRMRGGLDRYNGPAAKGYSKMPPALGDQKANEDEQAADNVDCESNPDEPVCQIEQAKQQPQQPPG
jgi:hypothetical protein